MEHRPCSIDEDSMMCSSDQDIEETQTDVFEECLTRSRDRNREHARKTRLRKKVHLQTLQKKVKDLQDENKLFRQTMEECSIASILLGLSSGDCKSSISEEVNDKSSITERTFFTVSGKRKRFVSDACEFPSKPMKLNIKGTITVVSGASSRCINWKTGVFVDEDGQQQQLSEEELEALRRERNRMHAKMTRDRKKVFISSVEKTIAELEEDNKRMKDIISKQALSQTAVTPENSPMITFHGTPDLSSLPYLKALSTDTDLKQALSKKSLDAFAGNYTVIG